MLNYACFGDSITSDFVTGIGTLVCGKLNAAMLGNFACGWAVCSDWHYGSEVLTKEDLVPVHTFSPQNVLSNQIRRFIKKIEETGIKPDICYIAISTNDGSVDWCTERGTPAPIEDDTQKVFNQKYEELDRLSVASGLRWAIETIQRVCPKASIYAASPIQAYSPTRELGALSEEAGLKKRELVRKVCEFTGVSYIDSYMESGFTREVAREHGEVHPDKLWADRIASFVAERIRG